MDGLSINGSHNPDEALEEALSLLPKRGEYKDLHFVFKEKDNENRQFAYGCDVLNKFIDEEFLEKLKDNWTNLK